MVEGARLEIVWAERSRRFESSRFRHVANATHKKRDSNLALRRSMRILSLPPFFVFWVWANTYTTGSTLVSSPFLAVYGGYYNNSTFNLGGADGFYWSSTAYDGSGAYRLGFTSGNANINYSGKRSGFSVRCVANQP